MPPFEPLGPLRSVPMPRFFQHQGQLGENLSAVEHCPLSSESLSLSFLLHLVTRGVLVTPPRMEPRPAALEGRVLTPGALRKSLSLLNISIVLYFCSSLMLWCHLSDFNLNFFKECFFPKWMSLFLSRPKAVREQELYLFLFTILFPAI